MRIVLNIIMQQNKEVLIEFSDSINVAKEHIDLTGSDDLGVKEVHLEVADYHT